MLFNLGEELSMEDNTPKIPEAILGADIDLSNIADIADQTVAAELELYRNEIKLEVAESAQSDFAGMTAFLEGTVATGGLQDQKAVQAFHRLYQRATVNFGQEQTVEIPSAESFGEEGAAEVETKLSMESVKEMGSKAAEVIRNLINAGIKIFKKFVAQHLTLMGRVKSATTSLLEQAGKNITGEMKSAKLKPGAMVYQMGDLTALAKYAKGVAGRKDLLTAIESYAGALSAVKEGAVANGLRDVNAAEEAINDAAEKQFAVSGAPKGDEKAVKARFGLDPKSYAGIKVSEELAGSVEVGVAASKADSALVTVAKLVTIKQDVPAEIDAVKKENFKASLDVVLELIRAHAELATALGNLNDGNATLVKAAETAKAVLAKDTSTEAKELLAKVKNLKGIASLSTSVHQGLMKHIALVANGRNQLVKASISNYGKKAAPAKEDKDEGGKDGDDK